MKLGDLEFVEHGKPIDLSTWLFDDAYLSELQMMIGRTITDAIRETFKTTPPRASFPFMWADGDKPSDGIGGPPVDDPVTIYIYLPLSKEEDEGCAFAISLEEIVDDFIDSSISFNTGKIHEREIPDKIAARLRELAQKLDDTRPTETESSNSPAVFVTPPTGEASEQGTGGPAQSAAQNAGDPCRRS